MARLRAPLSHQLVELGVRKLRRDDLEIPARRAAETAAQGSTERARTAVRSAAQAGARRRRVGGASLRAREHLIEHDEPVAVRVHVLQAGEEVLRLVCAWAAAASGVRRCARRGGRGRGGARAHGPTFIGWACIFGISILTRPEPACSSAHSLNSSVTAAARAGASGASGASSSSASRNSDGRPVSPVTALAAASPWIWVMISAAALSISFRTSSAGAEGELRAAGQERSRDGSAHRTLTPPSRRASWQTMCATPRR